MRRRNEPIRLLALVGTDYHPFQRLVDWVDAWSARQPTVECMIQYGTAAAPRRAKGTAYADHADLCKWMDDATILICHAGPSTILEARRSGHRPIVVPRLASLGEHVDNHQQLFTSRLAARKLVLTAGSQQEFDVLLDAAAADPNRLRLDEAEREVTTDEAVRRFADLVSGLFQR